MHAEFAGYDTVRIRTKADECPPFSVNCSMAEIVDSMLGCRANFRERQVQLVGLAHVHDAAMINR